MKRFRPALTPVLILFILLPPLLFLIQKVFFPFPKSETRLILEDTSLEIKIIQQTASPDGPVVFIVAGIHGDETAGWKAALSLAKESNIKRGTLHILPIANRYGVAHGQRQMENGKDLNRAFPGWGDGSLDQVCATAIFAEIKDIRPDLVLDLHEARKSTGDGGSGNSLIVSDFASISGLLMDFYLENEKRLAGGVQFSFTSPAVEGSLNRTVSDLLTLPVITVETMRSYPEEQRIKDQLSIIDFFLDAMGMK